MWLLITAILSPVAMSLGGGSPVYSHSVTVFASEDDCWRASDAAKQGLLAATGGQFKISAECVAPRAPVAKK